MADLWKAFVSDCTI